MFTFIKNIANKICSFFDNLTISLVGEFFETVVVVAFAFVAAMIISQIFNAIVGGSIIMFIILIVPAIILREKILKAIMITVSSVVRTFAKAAMRRELVRTFGESVVNTHEYKDMMAADLGRAKKIFKKMMEVEERRQANA